MREQQHRQCNIYGRKCATHQKCLQYVKQQTGYYVVYNQEQLSSEKVSVRAKNLPLEDFLELVFSEIPFEFSIEGKTISVRKKQQIIKQVLNMQRSPQFPAQLPPVTGTVLGRMDYHSQM